MKKRLLGILLGFALMMVMLPVLGVSQTAYADDPVSYNLWVGGVQVTNVNQDDVLWDDTKNKGKVSFDPKTYTLTLNGATITTGHSVYDHTNGIYYKEMNPLTIDLQSGSVNSISNVDHCIYSDNYSAALTISGDGALNASTTSYYGVGIYAQDALTIEDCTIDVVMGGNDARAILAETNNGVITIDGATVNASAPGTSAYGIRSLSAYVDIKSGSRVTAVGGIQGIGDNVKNHIAGTGWTDTAGTAGKEEIEVSEEGQPLGSYKKVKFPEYIEYPLWVKGTQVTSDNNTDVLGNSKVSYDPETHTLTLDGANITADTEKQHNYSAIYYGDAENELIIDAKKDSTVAGPNYDDPKEKTSYGICSESRVTVRGKLTAAGRDASSSYGVFAPAFVVEDKAEAKVLGSSGGVGIADGSSITVSGKLTAEGDVYGIYFYPGSTGIVTVNSGAELTATGGVMGIVPNSDNGYVEIKKGAKVRAVGGKNGFHNSAIEGIVKNAVPGLGWTNPEGTEGKTYFDINTQPGQKPGEDIKCAEFPAPTAAITTAPKAKELKYTGSAQELVTAGKAKDGTMKYALGTDGTTPPEKGWSTSIPKRTEAGTYYVWYMAEGDATHADSEPQGPVKVTIAEGPVKVQHTITYELNGGTLDGQTGTVTKKVDAGTVITLPAPVRNGYTFDYWEGSRYNAGDKYTVTGDHTFKAVWKTASGGGSDTGDKSGGSKGGDSKKGSGTKTGDDNALGAWVVLMLAALTGTAGMAFARKRRG